MAWMLDNVHELNKQYPYTFYLPSQDVLNLLQVNDMVKLIFLTDEENEEWNGERMWVEIIEMNDRSLKGLLRNEPVYISELSYDQEIEFTYENICSTQKDDPESAKWDYYFDKMITISNDALERDEYNFLLKHESMGDTDTGWTLFSGYEPEGSNNDPSSFQVVAIGVALNMDDSFLSFVDDEPYSAYERDFETGKLVKIYDYEWAE
jgi:hypothetical protein